MSFEAASQDFCNFSRETSIDSKFFSELAFFKSAKLFSIFFPSLILELFNSKTALSIHSKYKFSIMLIPFDNENNLSQLSKLKFE